jgi:hypothetical protein
MADWKDMSFREREAAIATAAGIETYQIVDTDDDEVVYRDPKDPSKLIKRDYAFLDDKITLGDATPVVAHTEYDECAEMAAFDLDPFDGEIVHFDGEMVLRTGKVFEAGDYPSHEISINESELADAAADFTPVDNDLEHKRTILDGKLGGIRSVVARGKELFATVAIPKWLNDLTGDQPIKTSLAWHRKTKRIVGNGLVLNPRIADAQLVAAFTAANTSTEGNNMPETKTPSWFERFKAHFSKNELPEELKDIDLSKVSFNDDPPAKDPEPKSAAPETHTAEFAELQGLRAAQLTTQAQAFFSDALVAHKVFPAEKASLEAQFRQACLDDNAGVVCFSTDGSLNEGSRVKSLRDGIAARVSYNLTEEQLADANLVGLSADTTATASDEDTPTKEGKKVSAARRAKLLAAGEIKVKEAKS